MMYDQTRCGKSNQRWRLLNWTTHISAYRPTQVVNRLLTAITMFSGSSCPMKPMTIMYDQTGIHLKWNVDDGSLLPWTTSYIISGLTLARKISRLTHNISNSFVLVSTNSEFPLPRVVEHHFHNLDSWTPNTWVEPFIIQLISCLQANVIAYSIPSSGPSSWMCALYRFSRISMSL